MSEPAPALHDTQALRDIVEPLAPPPQDAHAWAALAVAVALMLGVLFALRWHRRRRMRAAIRRLRQMRARFAAGELSPREAGYAVARELRRGLGLARLASDCAPAGTAKAGAGSEWAQLVQALDALRYAPGTSAATPAPAALFDQAETWLRRPEARC